MCKKLVITNDDFNVTLVEDKKKEIKNASVDFFYGLKNGVVSLVLDVALTGYFEIVTQIINENKISMEKALPFILANDKIEIPIRKINYNYKNKVITAKLLKNVELLRKIIDDEEYKKITTYFCKDEKDVLVACLYHFVGSGYTVNKCNNCGELFIAKNTKIKYCDRVNEKGMNCLQQHNSKKEMERRNKSVVNRIDKKIRDRLNARNNTDYETYSKDYKKAKIKYGDNEAELLEWLDKQDKKYMKRKVANK